MTFYAFMAAYEPALGGGAVTAGRGKVYAISEGEANALKGATRIDVASLAYEYDAEWDQNRILLNGPKPPVRDWDKPVADFNDQDATGVTDVAAVSTIGLEGAGPYESIRIKFSFDHWPPEGPNVGFILEYEAPTELIYEQGNTWLWVNEWFDHQLQMTSYDASGLGLSSFKFFTTGPGLPPEPFWAGLQNCAETV